MLDTYTVNDDEFSSLHEIRCPRCSVTKVFGTLYRLIQTCDFCKKNYFVKIYKKECQPDLEREITCSQCDNRSHGKTYEKNNMLICPKCKTLLSVFVQPLFVSPPLEKPE